MKMNNRLFLNWIFILFSFNTFSQNDTLSQQYFPEFKIQSIFSYYLDNSDGYHINEYTISNSLVYNPFKHLGLGFRFTKTIQTTSTIQGDNSFELWGAFIQGNLSKKKTTFYINVGYSNGNYCTCDTIYYYKSGLSYFSQTFGVLFKLNKNLKFDLGFNTNRILNSIPKKHKYNFPHIGLTYTFGFFKKE